MPTYTTIDLVTPLDFAAEELTIGDTVAFVVKMNSVESKLSAWTAELSTSIDSMNVLGGELEAALGTTGLPLAGGTVSGLTYFEGGVRLTGADPALWIDADTGTMPRLYFKVNSVNTGWIRGDVTNFIIRHEDGVGGETDLRLYDDYAIFNKVVRGVTPVGSTDLATKQYVDDNAGASADLTIENKTADYTVVLADSGKLITMNSAVAETITLPLNATDAFPIGAQLHFQRLGVGAVDIAMTAGDTLRLPDNATAVLDGQYAIATAVKIAATEWVLFGNLVPVTPLVGVTGTPVLDDIAVWTDSSTVKGQTLAEAGIKPAASGRTMSASGTVPATDLDNIVILEANITPTLFAASAGDEWRTITFFSEGAAEITIAAGGTTMNGNAKINQYEAVTATCVATGATTATVWYLTGGSA